ncbi:2,3,4,5-tetrahydropyridine-2,6-dicarboxylate N-succinyltransferase [Pelagibacteraceae bacterium]|nr:2,3,4,5-tetrahydropyridine-2,6-dicarboxylate N-succinyltransferase [Pelagibacteraceae bacterium]
MSKNELETTINQAWDKKEEINKNSDKKIIDAINQTINDLDSGMVRVAEKIDGNWVTHQHLKKAIMLSFRINDMEALSGPYSSWYDKAHLIKGKTAGWSKEDHVKAGFRMVPNSPVRKGSFVGKNVVLMPCFINIGAFIDEGTMMDTFSRAGSCCQIGKNCHISAGSGVGGVLEPAQALPTIIEDNVFLGAMSEVVEGVIVGEGSVISMGMCIGQSTKIVNRQTGAFDYGKIPPYSVVVPGSMPNKKNPDAPSLSCAVIIKQVDEKTRSKTSINDLLRE